MNGLSLQQQSVAWNLSGRVRNKTNISDAERGAGIKIIDAFIENAPELLMEIASG